MITINTNDDDNNNHRVFDYPNVYSFHLSNVNIIPTGTNGYVYWLVSNRNEYQIYIGKTNFLSQHLIQHNSGRGSNSTQYIMNRPWDIASYICGLSHMNKVHRMSSERRWKNHLQYLCFRGRDNSFSWINSGKHVV